MKALREISDAIKPKKTLFFPSGFKPIWSVGNDLKHDRIEQGLVELGAVLFAAAHLEGDQQLEGLQGLKCSFEANRSRLDVVCVGGLRHDRADEIVGQDVCPDFLTHEL